MNRYLFESILIAVVLTVLIFLPVTGFVRAYFDLGGASNNGYLDGIQVSLTGWWIYPTTYYQTSHTSQRWVIYPVATNGLMYSLFSGQTYSSAAYTSGNRVWSHYGDTTYASAYASSGFINQITLEVWSREVWATIHR